MKMKSIKALDPSPRAIADLEPIGSSCKNAVLSREAFIVNFHDQTTNTINSAITKGPFGQFVLNEGKNDIKGLETITHQISN